MATSVVAQDPQPVEPPGSGAARHRAARRCDSPGSTASIYAAGCRAGAFIVDRATARTRHSAAQLVHTSAPEVLALAFPFG
jgi:hypothetical protein